VRKGGGGRVPEGPGVPEILTKKAAKEKSLKRLREIMIPWGASLGR